jgi:hypothetical protein
MLLLFGCRCRTQARPTKRWSGTGPIAGMRLAGMEIGFQGIGHEQQEEEAKTRKELCVRLIVVYENNMKMIQTRLNTWQKMLKATPRRRDVDGATAMLLLYR